MTRKQLRLLYEKARLLHPELHREFEELKVDLFGEVTNSGIKMNSFVVIENEEKEKRHQQLLGLFYPCYRTEDWVNPVT